MVLSFSPDFPCTRSKTYVSPNDTNNLIKITLNGQPGTNDVFDIRVWAPDVDTEGDPTERAGGALQGGNIVVHKKNK